MSDDYPPPPPFGVLPPVSGGELVTKLYLFGVASIGLGKRFCIFAYDIPPFFWGGVE